MEIISISRVRGSEGTPDTFILGHSPIKDDKAQEGPVVNKIKYFGLSTVYDKIYRGPVYIVEFEGSTVKRAIPADKVIDIAVETEKREKKELPQLPE